MKNKDKTVVVFRKYKDGGIIALFPMIAYDAKKYTIESYMRIGQHCAAWYDEVLKHTKLATAEEYASLKEELENEPFCYEFIVQKKAYKFYWMK